MKRSWKHYFRRIARVTLVGSSAMVASAAHYAWAVASDNAGNAPYADGWQTGDNGGSGFGPWALISPYGGSFGIDNGPAANNALGAPAWQLNNTGVYGAASADRPFNSPLGVGETFRIDVDPPNAFIGGPYGYGGMFLSLKSGSGTETKITLAKNLPFGSTPPERVLIDDGTGAGFDTGITATTARAGLRIAVKPTGPATYNIGISNLLGTSLFSANRNLVSASPINSLSILLNANPTAPMWANNISIVPEPATGALLLVGVGGLLLGRIRTRRGKE